MNAKKCVSGALEISKQLSLKKFSGRKVFLFSRPMSVVNGRTLKNFLRLLFQNKMGVCLGNPFILETLISYLKSHFSLMASPQLRASLVAQLTKNLPSTQETLVRFLGWEDLLEKETATYSNILAWRIPWTV